MELATPLEMLDKIPNKNRIQVGFGAVLAPECHGYPCAVTGLQSTLS